VVGLDRPRHDQLRGLVSQAFMPRAIIQALLARTDGWTEIELIDDLA
jgi:hypothetical protein